MKDNFAVFIMVHGRPNKVKTYSTLRKQGYTGKIYLVADNLDETVDEYKKIYDKELIIFDKLKAAKKYDSGDNTGDLRSTLYAANTVFDIAEEMGIEYFSLMCDDYYDFYYAFSDTTGKVVPNNMNVIFSLMLDVLKFRAEFVDKKATLFHETLLANIISSSPPLFITMPYPFSPGSSLNLS